MITLRLATLDDLRTLDLLQREVMAGGWGEEAFATYLSNGNSLCLVAQQGEGPDGFIVARAAGGEAEILNIAVAEAARRRGVGGALVRASIAWSVERHAAEVIYIEVAEGNRAARAFYHQLGFTAFGRREQYYRHGRDRPEAAIIMRLALDPAHREGSPQ
jgi:ribosomal-protein-alanine N-acetyltransferase